MINLDPGAARDERAEQLPTKELRIGLFAVRKRR
jgi:hypothetical protein